MTNSGWRPWADRVAWVAAAAAVVFMLVGLLAAPPRPADRVEGIASQLRCPTCQNLSVADSPSETSQAMREIITQQVAEGHSDEEIFTFFIDRYGEWIILAPPAAGGTLALWLLPPAAVLLGLVVAVGRKRRIRLVPERHTVRP
ncbi:MAG: cytochrome c-type biogenesis protein [Acidimicrobiia bacterium]